MIWRTLVPLSYEWMSLLLWHSIVANISHNQFTRRVILKRFLRYFLFLIWAFISFKKLIFNLGAYPLMSLFDLRGQLIAYILFWCNNEESLSPSIFGSISTQSTLQGLFLLFLAYLYKIRVFHFTTHGEDQLNSVTFFQKFLSIFNFNLIIMFSSSRSNFNSFVSITFCFLASFFSLLLIFKFSIIYYFTDKVYYWALFPLNHPLPFAISIASFFFMTPNCSHV